MQGLALVKRKLILLLGCSRRFVYPIRIEETQQHGYELSMPRRQRERGCAHPVLGEIRIGNFLEPWNPKFPRGLPRFTQNDFFTKSIEKVQLMGDFAD